MPYIKKENSLAQDLCSSKQEAAKFHAWTQEKKL
jgi:hypothetical protein